MNEAPKGELADLQLFADPFEEFKSSLSDNGGWTAELIRTGEQLSFRREPNGAIRALSGTQRRSYRSLKALLVSEVFANLQRLASAQLHLSRALADPNTGELKRFLPSAGEIEYGDGTSEPLTFDRISELLARTENTLRVFVLDGVAGVGKTYLIERIVRERAASESIRNGNPLLLHVESRGKVLTSLHDRIAGTLSNLRASFFEEELKPLIRRGAVQLAIDGFDELSDSRGYDRAWGALRDFIRDLQGKGTCILAGRDTMLDRRTVLDGLRNTISEDSLVFLRLKHPPANEVRSWMSSNPDWTGQDAELNLLERQAEDSEYLRRPFFLSRIADLGPDRFREAQGEPVVELMESIVRREGPKLIGDATDIAPELASELCGQILSEVARMMMDDETDVVDQEWLALLIEEAFADHADPELVKALAQRAHALALLEEEAGDPRSRSFPHETVRSYFFARNIFDYFPEHGATNGMYRVPLGADDFRIFNRVARHRPTDVLNRLRKSMSEKLREATGYGYLRSNLGGLLLSTAPLADDDAALGDEPFALAHVELRDAWMADLLGAQRVELHDCLIHRLDVRGADLRHARFSGTTAFELLADPYVRFGETTPEVHSLIVYEEGRERRLFGPEAGSWVSARRSRSDQDDPEPDERLELLYKFARVSMRQYAIRSSMDLNDSPSRKILSSPHWRALRALLERHERLEVDGDRAASGPNSKWFHLIAGAEFLAPESATLTSTRRILDELNAPL